MTTLLRELVRMLPRTLPAVVEANQAMHENHRDNELDPQHGGVYCPGGWQCKHRHSNNYSPLNFTDHTVSVVSGHLRDWVAVENPRGESDVAA